MHAKPSPVLFLGLVLLVVGLFIGKDALVSVAKEMAESIAHTRYRLSTPSVEHLVGGMIVMFGVISLCVWNGNRNQ